MIHKHKRLSLVAVLVTVLLSSCMRDSLDFMYPSDATSAGGQVTFHINIPQSSLPSTRAIVEGSVDDNAVNEVTFLLFEPSDDGTGSYVSSAAATEIETATTDSKLKTFTVVLPDGAYDALIIANADDAFTVFKTANPGYEAEDRAFFETNLSTIVISGNATTGYTPWNANPTNALYKPFPMAGRFDIPAERTSSLGTIFLTRMLAKVNIKLAFDQTYTADPQAIFRLMAIAIPHFNTKGNLIPGNPGANALSVFDQTQLNIPAAPGNVSSTDNALFYTDAAMITPNAAGVPEQQIVDEIFVPELIKSTNSKEKPCILIGLWHPTLATLRWYRIDLQMTNPATTLVESVNLLRNFRYSINITAIEGNGFTTGVEAYEAPAEGIVATISAVDESDMNDITFDGRNQLATNSSFFVFQANDSKQELRVFTDYTKGWTMEKNTATWLTLSTVAGTLAGPGAVTTPVTLTPGANTGTTVRMGTITLQAGALRKTITVMQMPATDKIIDTPEPPTTYIPYVGAFWKAKQTGERLIRMSRPADDGAWIAVILDGEDWIQLDTLMTTDPNVGWLQGADETSVENGNDAAFDAHHQVIGDRHWVDGSLSADNPQIYFRIGLNGHYTPTAAKPARYGMILLAYNNYTKLQRIWVRQGEEADYIFGPADGRDGAVMFTPYNLTGPNMLGTTLEEEQIPDFADGGGRFTNYPTQLGAHFHGVSPVAVPRMAYNMFSTTKPLSWVGGVGSAWSTNPVEYETCPPGYRRPTDGPTDQVSPTMSTPEQLATSEMRQSLFRIIPVGVASGTATDNCISWGYYADGYFDRRQPVKSTSSMNNITTQVINSLTVVSNTNNDIAAVGWVHYNTVSGASLFFPAAGQRGNTGLMNVGAFGYYNASNQVRQLHVGNLGTGLYRYDVWDNSSGVSGTSSVRCVKDVSLPPTLTVTSELDDYDYTGGTQTINIESEKDDKPVAWQVTGYDTDGDGLFDDPAPDWLTLPTSSTAGTSNVTVKPFAPVSFSYDGVLQRATPKGTASAPHNLSVGEDGLAATANCYIVDAPGSYQLLLAYGNGINHGVDNPSAYVATVSGANVLSNMVRGDGNPANPIIAGLIADNTDLTTQPTGATLVWQDAPGLVTNLRLDATNSYLQFDVAQGSIKQGNAIVAVVSGSAILWSWHIWVTPMKMMEPTDAPVVNSTGTAFYMMNYNLGWMESPATNYGAGTYGDQGRTVEVRIEQTGVGKPANTTFTVTQTAHGIRNGGRGCYYQWGRKDPMPADGVTINTSTPSYAYTFSGGIVVMTVLRTISRPFMFINGSALGGAYGYDADENNNYWDNSNAVSGAATASLTSSVKTVVDPSPIGWKVAPAAAFTGFSTTTGGAFNGGWNFYRNPGNPQQGTINFPAGGYRDGSSAGSITEVGTAGRYWTAHPYSEGVYSEEEGFFTARYMDFGSGYVTPRQAIEGNDGMRANGFSVRPVRE